MSDDRTRELIGAWALDAVSDEERAAVDEYLIRSDDARAEATELADTAALLGASVAAEQPPAALKARLMEAIGSLTQVPAAEPERAARPTLTAVPSPAAEPTLASRSIARERRVYRFTRRTAAMFALAAAAVVGLTVGGIAVRDSFAPSGSAVAIQALENAPDAHTARASMAGGGTAEVVWSASRHRSAITVDGAAALSGSKVYQLWYIDGDGVATPAGFTDGSDDRSVMLEGRYRDGDTIGVTVEPKGGSDAPTTAPVVIVETV